MAEYNPSKIVKDGNTYNFTDATKIPLAGTNALAGSIVPDTDNSYDLGGSNYKLRYVYAGTAYVTNLNINGAAAGDIMTHNASEFVDVRSNQTIDGIKTFSNEVTMFGRDVNLMSRLHYGKNSNPSSTCWHYINFRGNTATEGYNNSWYSGYFEQLINIDGSTRGRWVIQNTSENKMGIQLSKSVDGSSSSIIPIFSEIDLGTPTNKWKSFNGVEPSGLSLPSDTSITIDTTGFAWGRNFTFTPSVNGYLFINIGSSNGIRSLSLKTGRGEYYLTNQTGILRFTMPVYKGKTVTILANSTEAETVIPGLSLFPCQGNV